MRIERKQFSGVMNLDDPNEVIQNSHHSIAYDIIFKGSPGEMVAEGVLGNRSVTNSGLQSGTNVCIGSYYDELKQRVFYFVYNSNGFDAIFVYNAITRAISTLLMSKVDSLSTEPLFDFSPDYPIASVNILYRSEDDGDILHWTDRNNRPMKLNIKEAEVAGKTYNGNWKKKYLTVARPMPLISPICKYEDDATTNINNLKSKLYQFRYRWIYRDNTKSTWSPWSRLFAPTDVDTIATEINPTKNNRISVKYNTGDDDVSRVEIAARQSIDNTFSDPFLVESIDKTGLFDNTDLEYKFYNTEAYPSVDVSESNQLFDYIPLKANTQELLNGNVLIYGGITEGRTENITPSVTKTLSLVQNTVTSTPFTMASYNRYTFEYFPEYNVTGGNHYIIFDGLPQVGDSYSFSLSFRRDIGSGVESATVTITVPTLTSGQNTQQQVEAILQTQLQANSTLQNYSLASGVSTLQLVEPGEFNGKRGIKIAGNAGTKSWVLDSYSFQYTYASGSGLPTDPTGVNIACYKHKSRYSFGLCYFDEYGVTNGVISPDSMKVITPEIDSADLSGVQLTIPLIQFEISHQAPTWAKYFSFVRTKNLTVSDFKTIITTTTYKDTGAGYAYLDITEYQNNKSGYPVYDFQKGDRVRIIGLKNAAESVYDYAVLSYVKSSDVSGLPPDKFWLRLQYDASTMVNFGTGGYNNYYIEVYTPSLNASEENQIYYEFGETYPVIIDGANRYHTGMTQNQTASLPAVYKFVRGDIYSRQRDSLWILDTSMSDKYNSKVDGTGRPFIIDTYAKETYYPTLVRYSLEYQAGTNINDTNRFYAANFDEYDRQRGDIQRLRVRGRQMKVFQNRACGVVPILQNVVQTADGNNILSQSVQIINRIQYYQGEFGIGNQYCSLASSANADYFADPVRGSQVRLSNDGITPISDIYKAHYYLNPLISKYNKVRNNITGFGKAKILGIYDQFYQEYICYMQESAAGDDKSNSLTISFNEQRNSYTSFYSYSPEWSESAGNLLITWKNGILYTHDNTTSYANFYGVQYTPYITLIFNMFPYLKKKYHSITELSNKVWISNNIGDVSTSLGQLSRLLSDEYIKRDDKFHATFKRDATSSNSINLLYDGNALKGNWLKIILRATNPNQFVNLSYVELMISQPSNNR